MASSSGHRDTPCSQISTQYLLPLSLTGRSTSIIAPPVAVKTQFQNIEENVTGDLCYNCITAGRFVPPGLFLDKTLVVLPAPLFSTAKGWSGRQATKEELAECNCMRESACMRSLGSLERLDADALFKLP
jgi:hypothetical protein